VGTICQEAREDQSERNESSIVAVTGESSASAPVDVDTDAVTADVPNSFR